jgi:hypothetical protein
VSLAVDFLNEAHGVDKESLVKFHKKSKVPVLIKILKMREKPWSRRVLGSPRRNSRFQLR